MLLKRLGCVDQQLTLEHFSERYLIMPPRKTLKLPKTTNQESNLLSKTQKTPHTIIEHPETGKSSFGIVPERKSGHHLIPKGEIQLRYGKHRRVNSGFGASHIWAEHQKEMSQVGFNTEEEVSKYVAYIIETGSPIYFSADSIKDTRISIVRSKRGTAILQLIEYDDYNVWSVVTAFSRTNANGSRVGAVE